MSEVSLKIYGKKNIKMSLQYIKGKGTGQDIGISVSLFCIWCIKGKGWKEYLGKLSVKYRGSGHLRENLLELIVTYNTWYNRNHEIAYVRINGTLYRIKGDNKRIGKDDNIIFRSNSLVAKVNDQLLICWRWANLIKTW